MDEFNVAILVLDTLRKDVMGMYGGEASMPSLEAFARDSMVFRNCYAPSPWTVPSHVSLFTGLYPKDHGVHEWPGRSSLDIIKKLEEYNGFWLPSYMQGLGYSTIGFSGNFWVSQATGFSRGFGGLYQVDRYTNFAFSNMVLNAGKYGTSELDILRQLIRAGKFREILNYATLRGKKNKFDKLTNFPEEKGSKLIMDLLENTSLASKFFLFMNLFEMHDPSPAERRNEVFDHHYGVKPMSMKRAGILKKDYTKQAGNIDHYIGKFVSLLKSKNAYENTLIIITSDHGQAFLEHGYLHHGSCLYDEITSIPLIVKPPKGRRIQAGTKTQSLVSIPSVIIKMRESDDPVSFDSDIVFSESHGNVKEFPQKYSTHVNYLREQYQLSRFAAMRDGYKLSLNARNNAIEEFTLKGKPVDPDANKMVVSELSEELKKYQKKFTEKESSPQEEKQAIQ